MRPAPRVRRLALLSLVLALLAGCATAPTEYREPTALAANERTALNLAVFDRAWTLVNEQYFDASFHGIDWLAMRARYRPEAAGARNEEELYRVLNLMSAELHDRHVYAISPRQVHEVRQHHAMGFGFREHVLQAGRTVTDVFPGSPAEVAGIRVGWRIISPEIAQLDFAAGTGESASLVFLDEREQSRALTISPTLLPLAHLRTDSHLLTERVLYLRFDHFDQNSRSWLSRELKRHLTVPAVVIDLRENSGGDSTSLQLAVREFFAEGRRLGQSVDRTGDTRNLDTLSVLSARYPGKVIVLISGTTASSAEIFAHALQFHRRATLIGRRTAGSVVEGFKHHLPDGGYMNVAERDFVGLDSQRLEGRGVKPDLEVPSPGLADLRAGKDRDLDAALQLLQSP